MDKRETSQFLAVVKTAYPHFEIAEPVVRLWHEYLMEIPFIQAKKNLQEHIRSNRFPPTISEIVRHDPNQFTDHNLLTAHTEDRFTEMEEWEQKAIDCPPHLLRLKSGDDD